MKCELSINRPADETLLIRLSGDWKREKELPSANEVEQQIGAGSPVKRIAFDSQNLGGWDSSLLTFLIRSNNIGSQRNTPYIPIEKEGLPSGKIQLLTLAGYKKGEKDYASQRISDPGRSRLLISGIDTAYT